MKLTVSGLQAIISRMVQEEIDRLLPTLVAESISELYLRGLVSEAVSRSQPMSRVALPKRTVREQASRPATPTPVRKDPEIVSAIVSRKNPLLEQKNPFHDIYEGTVPIDEAESAPPADDVDLNELGFGLSTAAMQKLAGIE